MHPQRTLHSVLRHHLGDRGLYILQKVVDLYRMRLKAQHTHATHVPATGHDAADLHASAP